MEWWAWTAVVVVILAVIWGFLLWLRRHLFVRKYGDPGIVDRIIDGKIWQGQSREQLLDAIGEPEDVHQRVYKTKVKETWKYNEVARNRFGLKVVLENGVVVGWEKRT